MTPTYHKFNTYSQLRKVVLGSFFPEDYFDCIQDLSIRYSVMKIAREINEDLQYYQKVLEDHNVTVIRPTIPAKNDFIDHWFLTGKFLSPPLQPRNFHSVVGHKIYQLTTAPEVKYINQVLPGGVIDLSESNLGVFHNGCELNRDCYNSDLDLWFCRGKYQELAGPDWPKFHDYVRGHRSSIPFIEQELKQFEDSLCYETKEFTELLAPNLFPVDGTLYIDCKEYFDYKSWAEHHIEYNGKITILNSKAGHSDGCFVVLGNNVIIGVVPSIDYTNLFPNYRVVKASDSYMDTVRKRKAVGPTIKKKWWVPGEEDNTKLINYVDTYMQNYIGNAYETSFDLNVLAINKDTICMVVTDPAVVHQLNEYGINVIKIPWRHRFFVDCGLHCLTLDLYRKD